MGYRGASHRLYRISKQRKLKSEITHYQHRKTKKRLFRRLWISRINAILALENRKYSEFMATNCFKSSRLNRKTIAQLSLFDPHFMNPPTL